MAAHAEQGEHRDVIDHMMGGGDSSPFNIRSLMQTGLSGGRAETGGGTGANYKPEIAQGILDHEQQNVNIYESIHSA
jgi:hypothetical protein